MFEEQRQLFDQRPASHEDRFCDSQIAKVNPLLHNRNTEGIHIRFDERRNAIHAMTVGIGFDHRHDLRRCDMFTNGFKILFELGKVNFKIGWTHYFLYQ